MASPTDRMTQPPDDAALVARHVVIDVRTPEKWTARHFWAWRGRRTLGFVAAFCPTVMGIGIEVLAGYGKGLALIVGPFWLGFATAALEPSDKGVG